MLSSLLICLFDELCLEIEFRRLIFDPESLGCNINIRASFDRITDGGRISFVVCSNTISVETSLQHSDSSSAMKCLVPLRLT